MWKNIVERGKPQMTMWRMRIACWISTATNTHIHTHTHTGYITIIGFPLQPWLHERPPMVRYTYIGYLV